MISPSALEIVLRRTSDPSPQKLQAQGWASLEALEGLNSQEALEVACRNVLVVLLAARPRLERQQQDRPYFDMVCDAVEQWFQQEIAPLRLTRPN
jgi:hypothetical protein